MRLLLMALIVISVLSKQGGQDQKQTDRHDENATQKATNPPQPSPTPIPQFSAVHADNETHNKKPAAEAQTTIFGFTRFELTMAVLTGIYVVLTAFYAITSAKTLTRIEQQIEVADRAAEAAENAANRTAQLERPWIILEWGKNYDTSYNISIRNCGRTVARIISAHSFVEIKDSISDLPKTPYYGIAGDQREVILGPDDIRHFETFDIVIASNGKWNDVLGEQKILVYWGCIRYEDADRNSHETRFSYRYDNSKRDFMFDGPHEYNKFT